jgi:predicted GNAT family acetyltransferase
MHWVIHANAAEFVRLAEPFLMANELANAVTLGAALQGKGRFFATASSNDVVVATAFSANGAALWLSDGPIGAATKLAELIVQTNQAPREVCAPNEIALEFTERITSGGGVIYAADYGLRLYQVNGNTLMPVVKHAVAGSLVVAHEVDLPLVRSWVSAFGLEVNYGDDAGLQSMAKQALLDGRLYFWSDAQPLAMLWRSSPTANTERIAGVFTPTAQRGQGYSAAANLALAKLILAEGKSCVCLLADVTNPISNAMYVKLGYQPALDFQRYLAQ